MVELLMLYVSCTDGGSTNWAFANGTKCNSWCRSCMASCCTGVRASGNTLRVYLLMVVEVGSIHHSDSGTIYE